jgi:ankyrin repeat protein
LASQNGHTEVVKLLLADKRVDPSSKNNFAIQFASRFGHTEIVKLLSEPRSKFLPKWSLQTINILTLSNEEKFRVMLSLHEDNKLDDLTSKLIYNSDFIDAYLASNEQLADMLKTTQIPIIPHLNHAAAAALYSGDVGMFKTLTPLSSHAAYENLVK